MDKLEVTLITGPKEIRRYGQYDPASKFLCALHSASSKLPYIAVVSMVDKVRAETANDQIAHIAIDSQNAAATIVDYVRNSKMTNGKEIRHLIIAGHVTSTQATAITNTNGSFNLHIMYLEDDQNGENLSTDNTLKIFVQWQLHKFSSAPHTKKLRTRPLHRIDPRARFSDQVESLINLLSIPESAKSVLLARTQRERTHTAYKFIRDEEEFLRQQKSDEQNRRPILNWLNHARFKTSQLTQPSV